jgi:hypothetical protein
MPSPKPESSDLLQSVGVMREGVSALSETISVLIGPVQCELIRLALL